jgi:myo-inositol-1(or 4)-monophosphatase
MPINDQICRFSMDICIEAGKILLSSFRSNDMEISYKSRTDLVTNMDYRSEEFLFNSIRAQYPDHDIIAEEGSRKDTDSEYLWYVDPLDATNNYAHGIPFFCISVGVYSRSSKSVVAGAVYDPCHDEMFSAVKNCGAFCNDYPLKTSYIQEMGVALLATGFPYNKDDMTCNNLNEFNRFLPRVQCIRRIGSAALDLCYLAAGRLDGYWEPMLKPWDTAAGSLIVSEAGGKVTKYNGETFDPEYPEILASNGFLHSRMVSILTDF